MQFVHTKTSTFYFNRFKIFTLILILFGFNLEVDLIMYSLVLLIFIENNNEGELFLIYLLKRFQGKMF